MKIRSQKSERGKKLGSQDRGPNKGSGQEYPAFSLRYLSPRHCITGCTKDQMASFAEKIKQLTQMSWLAIGQAPRHGLGYEKIYRHQIRAAIPENITPDVEYFLAFRFAGRAPMIGHKQGETFYVLWFDPRFEVYPH